MVGVLAIAVSLTLIGLLAQVTPMSVFVLNLTSMVGLGVGIDYSLLMVTRFREELNRGLRRREAAIRALETAGSAVVTSGLTVVVGLGALLFTPLVDTPSVGLGGLVVVAVAVLLTITLLPALLATMGHAIDKPRWLARRLAWYHAPQVCERWARTLTRHPWRALALGTLAIAAFSWPLTRIRIGLCPRRTGGRARRKPAPPSRISSGWAAAAISSPSGSWSRCPRETRPRRRLPSAASGA